MQRDRIWLSLGSVGTWLALALACQAQVWPDASLGPESSTLAPDGLINGLPALLIEGGAQRGQNLFHSFLEFNVDLQQRVYFANPAAVSNIFTRITGSHPSEIWGTLGVDGEANLYLLNPNGFLFGDRATLDIAGSLMVSTGEDLPFADGFRYAAIPTQTSDVLTMSVPLGLQTGLPSQGTIRNLAQITLNPEQSLTFLGHQVEHLGSLASPGGTLQLLGNTVTVGENATLDVSAPNGGGNILIGGAFQGDDSLPAARITQIASGVTLQADALDQGNGGLIIVWADESTQFLGTATARGGANGGNGGLVEISALDQLHYGGQVDTRAPQGTVGLLLLDPTTIEVVAVDEDTTDLNLVDEFGDPDLDPATQRTRIAARALETTLSNVVLQAAEDIIVNADVFMVTPGVGLTAQAGRDIIVNRYVQAAGSGDLSFLAGRNLTFNGADAYAWSYGGDIVLNAGETVSLLSGAQADTAPFDGDSGNLRLAAQRLTMTDGAQLKTGPFFSGAGGNLTVDVADTVELSGVGVDPSGTFGSTGFIASSLLFSSTGTSGNITAQAPIIRLVDGAAIGTQSINNQPGGNITINAPTLIQISGVASSPTGEFRSSISASSSSNAAAGQVTLQTSQLVIEDGGFVGASGTGLSGPGGVVTINTEQIQMNGRSPEGEPSGVFTRSFTLANAGDIFINNSGNITLDNGALIDVSSLGFGASGQLSIKTHDLRLNNNSIIFAGSLFGSANRVDVIASGTVLLNNNSTLFGDTFGQGAGANISIQSGRLEVFNRSFISTATLEAGGGGNLNIQASEAVELANGFLNTGTFDAGNGGNLIIRTPTLLIDGGLVESNSFGSGIAGNVDLNVGNLIIRDSGEVSVRGFSANARTGNILIVADTILLENEGKILASAPSTNGGNIDLTANQRLVMRGNSLISANAGDPLDLIAPPPGTGNGGNIRVAAPFVIVVREEDSDITATASLGNGGRVEISTRGLFGLEFRDRPTPLSDITASSEFGLSGTVDINALDTTAIENSLVGLPESPLTTDTLVSGSCLAPQEGTPSTFVITGAGGLPAQPDSGRVSTFPTGEVRGVDEPAVTEEIRPVWQPGDPIVEPTGVYQLDNGRWVLGRACQ